LTVFSKYPLRDPSASFDLTLLKPGRLVQITACTGCIHIFCCLVVGVGVCCATTCFLFCAFSSVLGLGCFGVVVGLWVVACPHSLLLACVKGKQNCWEKKILELGKNRRSEYINGKGTVETPSNIEV